MNDEELILKVLYEKPNKPENVVKSKHVKFEELKIAYFDDDNVPDSKLPDYENRINSLLDDLRELKERSLIEFVGGTNAVEPLNIFITEKGKEYYVEMYRNENHDE
ncbi:MAG: hypothetical protein WC570_00220 [Patescibacteria group bacterium]